MSSRLRTRAVPSRRRPQDEGEEEQSLSGEIEDDSLSEGSVLSNEEDDADVEGSDASVEDKETSATSQPVEPARERATAPPLPASTVFKPTVDTQAMLNGLKSAAADEGGKEIQFEDATEEQGTDTHMPSLDDPAHPGGETPAERSKREHQEYVKQRDSNPAFVPTRGGFFLHDDRSTHANGHAFRGQRRPRGPLGSFPQRHLQSHPPAEKAWEHDLHESVSGQDAKQFERTDLTEASLMPQGDQSRVKTSVSAPNRSFSTSAVLGNVTVRISFPGMIQPITVPNIVKKQHTLLPQHRPPLRRDKPVRVSVPDQPPRYIFPSTERSFIFIPRALRPNQQAYARGRGRGSFYGSRRPSILGGSTHTPSVAMSRRSSFGVPSRDEVHSPRSFIATQTGPYTDPNKPVVRLPVASVGQPHQINGNQGADPLVIQHRPYENQVHAIPMHQPKPQKTVSVADIETPVSFDFKPPQQQQEQPFHQQVPAHIVAHPLAEDPNILYSRSRRQSHAGVTGGTPLSQIPERAIYAQPFQPYPMFPHGYFPIQFHPGATFFPAPGMDTAMFNGAMPTSVLAPNFVPGVAPGSAAQAAPQQPADSSSQPNTLAHESNGMVYYYDPSLFPPVPQGPMTPYGMPPGGGVVGMGGMMTPPAHFYYPQAPNGMFYNPQ